jgi:predicted RNA-binding protein associated with RNAse of E/G family
MTKKILVHKLNENGEEVLKYPGTLIEQTDSSIRVQALFDRDDVVVGSLLLSRGDTFIETYYFDRWYNTFAVFENESEKFKGWYCNITRPARVEGKHIYAEDLALDLVVQPDGSHKILDQDEFEELQISEVDRLHALQTLHELQEQAKNREGIFAKIPQG